MRPLDPLSNVSRVAQLLGNAPTAAVTDEIERVATLVDGASEQAALDFARGAVELRAGRLDLAARSFELAAQRFSEAGEVEAAALCRAEHCLAHMRRDPVGQRAAVSSELEGLRVGATSDRVRAVALHYLGTLARASGRPIDALRHLVAAHDAAAQHLPERAQIMNSLGTLHVALGAFGAAEAVLEHAAEVARRLGDAIGEAIAHGQLGAAALARGEHERARRHLQRQEWLSTTTGDAFGRARALVWLAELALDTDRPDDARTLARLASDVARSVDPPLAGWLAFAERIALRADLELGIAVNRTRIEAARATFERSGNLIGAALTHWDEAKLTTPADVAELRQAARVFASLSLAERVARVLDDARRGAPTDAGLLRALLSLVESSPHLSERLEGELLYAEPGLLAEIGSARLVARRNLARLAALSLAPPGLYVAALATSDGSVLAAPDQRASAAQVASLGAAAIWVWSLDTAPLVVAQDLAKLRASCSVRVTLDAVPEARVIGAPFQGDVGAGVLGVELTARLATVLALDVGEVALADGVPWSDEASAVLDQGS